MKGALPGQPRMQPASARTWARPALTFPAASAVPSPGQRAGRVRDCFPFSFKSKPWRPSVCTALTMPLVWDHTGEGPSVLSWGWELGRAVGMRGDLLHQRARPACRAWDLKLAAAEGGRVPLAHWHLPALPIVRAWQRLRARGTLRPLWAPWSGQETPAFSLP